jgi:holo-[acyl-carrier protein] synthase
MIIGIGTDILTIDRAQAALSRTPAIAKRVLTPEELHEFSQAMRPERYFAKRFCAKEAVVKALGTGIGRGVSWQHVQIHKNALGKPLVTLTGGALEHAMTQGIETIHLSYSDEQDSVVAFAVAESV